VFVPPVNGNPAVSLIANRAERGTREQKWAGFEPKLPFQPGVAQELPTVLSAAGRVAWQLFFEPAGVRLARGESKP
jgi:hypothetical protein